MEHSPQFHIKSNHPEANLASGRSFGVGLLSLRLLSLVLRQVWFNHGGHPDVWLLTVPIDDSNSLAKGSIVPNPGKSLDLLC